MDYKRFKQLWDALIKDRPSSGKPVPVAIGNGMSSRTFDALVAYARGDKKAFDEVKAALKSKPTVAA